VKPAWGISCCECGREAERGAMGRCPMCGGILAPHYPDESVAQLSRIEARRGLDRFRAVLPVSVSIPYRGEGDTPLLASRRLGPALGLSNLYFKNEGGNPSGAFKDRGGAMVAALALEAGAKGIVTASSGNAAAAISAYAAAAGLPCVILFEPGNPTAKLRQALATGARVLPVEGVFAHGPEAIAELIQGVAFRLSYYPSFIWAPVNPYILEGMKTVSYELVAQLPGPPDVVVCPVGGGDLLTAQWRGYLELQRAGVISRLPRMVAVQSESAPPLLQAFRTGAERVPTLPYARSRISGINVPFTGDHALAAIRQSGGSAAGVVDEEVFAMQARIGREEGVWAEPASAAPVTALAGLLERGDIRPDETVVCIMSGAGFKDTLLAQAETEAVGARKPVPFDAEAIAREAVA
jgi:threonine synthase